MGGVAVTKNEIDATIKAGGAAPTLTPRMRVCVFGSSSPRSKPSFLKAASELGKLLSEGDHICVNGAGNSGCMGALNDACVEHNGEIHGVIHQMWVRSDTRSELHQGIKLENLVIVDGPNLTERKCKLMEECDAVVVLPGGLGTFDELFEAIAERQLGLASRPITLLNVDGFYDDVWAMLEKMKATGLLYVDVGDLIHMANTPKEALDHCIANWTPPKSKTATSSTSSSSSSSPSSSSPTWMLQLASTVAVVAICALVAPKIWK